MTRERWAALAFGAYLVAAFCLIVLHFGADQWFFGDEWGLLVDRSLTDSDALFRPQNGHWSTIPIVVYQVLFRVFGLGSYVPVLAVLAVLHLTLATMIRLVMRRAGVGPWVATFVAGVFVLFGTGSVNILWGVQISMVGSMVAGFAHLILADHDGRFDRRDGFGLAAGLVGLMSSGIGVLFVFVVGLAVLIRRGWRMCLAHVVPLAFVYGLWSLAQRDALESQRHSRYHLGEMLEWVVVGQRAVQEGLTQHGLLAVGLVGMSVLGLVLAWRSMGWSDLRRSAAVPLAALVGSAALFAAISTERWVFGSSMATSGRYVSMGAALTLPAIGVAVDAVVRRWRVGGVVAAVVLGVGVVGNLGEMDDHVQDRAFYDDLRTTAEGAAHSPVARQVDPAAYVDPYRHGLDEVTVGFLLDAVARGLVPRPDHLSPVALQRIETRLLVSQSRDPMPESSLCGRFSRPLELSPDKGDQFGFRGDLRLALGIAGEVGPQVTYSSVRSGEVLTVQADDLELIASPAPDTPTFTWCPLP